MANNRPSHLPRIPETPMKLDSSIQEIPSSVTPTNAAPRLRSIFHETEGKSSGKVKIRTNMKSSFFKTEKALKDAQKSPNSEAGAAERSIRTTTDSRSPSTTLSRPDSPSSVSVSSDSSLAAVTRTLDKFKVKSSKPVRLKWDSSNDEDEPNQLANSEPLKHISDTNLSPPPQQTRIVNNLKRKKRRAIQSDSESDQESSSQDESRSQTDGSDISSKSANKKMRSQSSHIDEVRLHRPTLDHELEKKIDSLQLSFPSFARAEITQALVRANGLRVKAASELLMKQYLKPPTNETPNQSKVNSNTVSYRRPSALSKSTKYESTVPTRDTKVHIAKVGKEDPSQNMLRRRRVIAVDSDSEDAISTDDDSSDAASDTDFALDDQMKNDKQTVDFFNESSCQDIQDVTACTIEQAQTIINELRPFQDMDDLQRKLKITKGLGERFINAYREMMQGYSAVDKLIDDIEKIGIRIEEVMQIWNKKEQGGEDRPASEDAILKVAKEGYLYRQPELMSSEITLKGYQVFGVNWILLLYRMKLSGILADEMGLGKTAQVIGFLAQLVSQGNTGPHLVVVPSSTLENWLREFQKFCPSLDVRSYFGSQVERRRLRYDLREDASWSILVTTYQMATGAELDRKFLRKLKFDVTILDEGHMVKNCTSARYHHLMAIPSSFRLLLTGTPLQNNLQELVSLLTFILPSMFKDNQEELTKIFKIRQTVKDKKEPPKSMQTKAPAGSTNIAQMLSMERIKRAKKIMTPFVLRRQKSQVYTDLPSKLHVLKRCPMSDRQAAVYKKVVEDSKISLKMFENKSDGETDIIRANDDVNTSEDASATKPSKAVNILMNLRKAAIHPLLLRSIYTDDILRQMSKAIMRVSNIILGRYMYFRTFY
jgi:SNF2 family DNA or RNA helicase